MELVVDRDAVRANARTVREMVDGTVVAVVKGIDAAPDVVQGLVDAGIGAVGVSRVQHLRRLQDVDAELVMVRVPARTEIEAVVRLADVTVHASRETVRRSSALAERAGTTHDVIPMIDGGDGREGVDPAVADEFLATIEALPAIRIAAVGVNRGCFGDRPDGSGVQSIADAHPERSLSVGGSAYLPIRDRLPDAVTRLRIGDAILTGRWESQPIEGLTRETIRLEADVLARHDRRTIVDVGSVTSDPRGLIPTGPFEIARTSTEQAVLVGDVPEGSRVSFEVTYEALARAANGPAPIRVKSEASTKAYSRARE